MRAIGWGWLLVGLAGCGGGGEEVYKRETFEVDSPFQIPTEVPAAQACEAARRALLGQGYLIDAASAGSIRAKKSFRPSTEESHVLEMHVVCVERDQGTATTLYANAVEVTYAVKKNAQSASVGVSSLGSVSVPLRSTSDSMVKTSEATIQDKVFYERFFALLEHYLQQPGMAQAPPEAGKP